MFCDFYIFSIFSNNNNNNNTSNNNSNNNSNNANLRTAVCIILSLEFNDQSYDWFWSVPFVVMAETVIITIIITITIITTYDLLFFFGSPYSRIAIGRAENN